MMADAEKIKITADMVLFCVEKVSSIIPYFGIVSSLVGVARKLLIKEEGHALDLKFELLRSELETISENSSQCLEQILMNEVNETYGKYEEYIKHQYTAFNDMVAKVKKDPDDTQLHMTAFKEIYERDKGSMSLDVYYHGVMEADTVFARPLLNVYLDKESMERRCSHIIHLFQMGLIALMAYTAVMEDDEDEVQKKWAKRVKEIQEKMQEVLSQCEDTSS